MHPLMSKRRQREVRWGALDPGGTTPSVEGEEVFRPVGCLGRKSWLRGCKVLVSGMWDPLLASIGDGPVNYDWLLLSKKA